MASIVFRGVGEEGGMEGGREGGRASTYLVSTSYG